MPALASILIVDDQPELLDNISLALDAAGYPVLTASDGLAALALLEDQPVSLILADISMPGMNGYQLYQRVRENPAWTLLPFLFLTGRGMDSDIRYGKELGVDDYLVKPIEVEDLLAVIQGKLRRSQQLAALYSGPALATEAASPPAPEPDSSPRLVAGRLAIAPGQHRAWLDGHLLQLSAREFKLLAYLAERRDQVVLLEELIQVTHDLKTDAIEAGNLLRPLVRTLRRKLGYNVGEAGCLESVRGVGYRLVRLV